MKYQYSPEYVKFCKTCYEGLPEDEMLPKGTDAQMYQWNISLGILLYLIQVINNNGTLKQLQKYYQNIPKEKYEK